MAEDEVVSQLESVDDYVNPLKLLKSTSKNKNNIVISYLNVNSIRNKLDDVRNLILDNVDILCISESKLDSSFPIGQFSVPGFKQPVRLDVSDKSGGLLLFCRDYLPFRQLHCPVLNEDIQCIVSDLNLRKQKWLILSIYRNPKQNIRYFLDEITNVLDYSSSYENIIIMGDFNEEITQSHMNNFLSQFSLYSLIKKPTCYKSSDGRCIDLILTNKNRSFQKSNSFETGISDHHNLIYTMFKTTYEKSPPQVVHFRSFRNFSFEYFQKDLTNCLDQSKPGDFDSFSERFESVLDVHAPKKKRTIRGNQKHHLTKTLRQAIMRRSFLKNRATRTGNAYYYELYKKQRNYVVNLNRKAKESYFQTLETSADFWKSTKHLFSKGSHVRESILLLDDHNNVEKNQHIFSHMLNTYFVNITNTLDLTSWETCLDADIDDIELILKEYSNHPSIKLISRSTDSSKLFSFANVTPDQVHRVILDLDPKKSVSGPIPSKIVRMVADIISSPIAQCLNSAIKFSTFPQSLKLADISPIFKKGDKFLKENYRPISILPSFSKIFEKVLFSQLTGYFDSILHPHICGFRSKHNTQHALLRMIGKWHQCLDRSGKVGAILMDLSKAFDCIEHDLLIAKLAAYGLDRASLKLVKCYLSNRYQRTKVGSVYSSLLKILKGVPQGSILGPLFFNIFINDLLEIADKTDICNFADDNTIYSCANTIAEVTSNLKKDLSKILSWFRSNLLAANPAKFQMLVMGENNSNLPITIYIENFSISSTETVELLGISIDSKLSFSNHISVICRKAGNRVRNLNRFRSLLMKKQLILLFNSYILSAFNYAPILWMYCSKTSCREIDTIHKRALRAVCQDFSSDYEVLLQKAGYKRIHEIHLRFILCEIYKTLHDLNPSFMQTLFRVKPVRYALRNQNLLILPCAKSSRFGTQSFPFRGSLLWNTIRDSVKSQPSLNVFKQSLKAFNIMELCSCKICSS